VMLLQKNNITKFDEKYKVSYNTHIV